MARASAMLRRCLPEAHGHFVPLFSWVAGVIEYTYDQLDEQALIGALDTTDDAAGHWFQYPLLGSLAVSVRLARSPGSAVLMTQVRGDLDDVLAARIDTLIAVSQGGPDYRICRCAGVTATGHG